LDSAEAAQGAAIGRAYAAQNVPICCLHCL